jgi:UDP-N-acetylglucosamine transferase subunit ALG13
MQSSSVRSSSSEAAPPGAAGIPAVATLVTAGTHEDRFHTLEAAVIELAASGTLALPALIQTGADNSELELPEGVTAVEFLDPPVLEALMRSARYVITQGGPGSIFMAIEAGHRPIAVGRSAAHGEHVDDHQKTFVRVMGERGLVNALEQPADLAQAIGSLRSTVDYKADAPTERESAADSFTKRFEQIADSLLPRKVRPAAA